MLRDIRFLLKPLYTGSRALIVGIDNYKSVSSLSYAVSDAEAMRDSLIDDLGFATEDIVCLLNENATKSAILREYLRFADTAELDDRIIFFFAGHGHTLTGIRGEVGFLIPFDADPGDLSSLVRWSDLTVNSELVRAKHMLFLMDACYGGLALTRSVPPGSARFLRDMLLRYSRQVLTAGKADEEVSDSGGPLPDHSIFTGHLILGLKGAAMGENGILTASGLMSYVYSKVATDKNSNQTPHFGHFDGDGDMILTAPQLDKPDCIDKKDVDTLIVVPVAEERPSPDARQRKVAQVKSLLASDASSIELHDFVMEEVRRLLAVTSEDFFAPGGKYSDEEFLGRITNYETAAGDLSLLLACVAYWARPHHRNILRKAISRSVDHLEMKGGLSIWLDLRWYPAILETYSAGIAAVQGGRYDSLAEVFFTKAWASEYGKDESYFVSALSQAVLELTRLDAFKHIPGHERHYVPMSEYLYKVLQPQLDDVLFVGKDYDRAFDEFEVLFALTIADLKVQRKDSAWGPIGRFGWKQPRGSGPLTVVINEARATGQAWPPLTVGFFGGSMERFEAAAIPYLEAVSKLGWL